MIRFIARAKASIARRQFESAVRRPEARQARVWAATLRAIRRGTFWPARVSSASLADYPITDYSFYQAAFESDLAGARVSRLTGEEIVFWAESSGTTGTIKHFPLTRLYQKQFQTVNLPYAASVFRHDPAFFTHSLLYLAAPAAMERAPTGIPKGLISGFNYRNIPPLLARKYALPSALLEDPALYAEWAARYALAADVGTIFSIAPSKISALLAEIERRREEFAEWLSSGAPVAPGLPPVRVSSARLAFLSHALRAGPARLTARSIWPNLRLIGCWKTGPCRFQLAELSERVEKDVILLDAMYTATEAWMNVPVDATHDGGPLHPDSAICEFIEEGREITAANLLPMTALEEGKTYEVFVTSLMGLVRYRMFDLVRCTGFYGRSPWIEFVQKSSQVLSLGWTRVSEADLYQAFREAGFETDPAGRFLVGADAQSNSLRVLEFAEGAATPSLDAGAFDLALQRVNGYYRSDREKGVIPAPAISRRPVGERDRFYGRSHLQSKPTLLTKNPV